MRNESRDSFVFSDANVDNLSTYNTAYEPKIEPRHTSHHINSGTEMQNSKFVVFYRVHGKQTWRPFCASLRKQDRGAPHNVKCNKNRMFILQR